MTVYTDTNYGNDHSYYGRGCKNLWGTDGYSGSQTPCDDSDAGGRYVTTADGETQKNGTYYNFQAITDGTGASVSIANTSAPDTFCPLGWQLPYSGTGGDYYDKSRSWKYLFDIYNIVYNSSSLTEAAKIVSYPFSYVYPGYFHWSRGRLYQQSLNGPYWSSIVADGTKGHGIYMWDSYIRVPETNTKYSGNPIRYVPELVTRIALHGIRVHSLVLWLFIF